MRPWHVLALSLSQSYVTESLFNKFRVHVSNGLGNFPLQLHCKSKNSDLGFHVIPVNGEFQWNFRTNFFETTLFWCTAWWDRGYLEFKAFTMNEKTLTNFCDLSACTWKAQQDGMYMYHAKNKSWEKRYDWGKP
ncbi:hypothetical protein L1049_004189 [Liquidambar formosana]|uniref:S-protein homolog n=1 Tax=Liquidambar formosana TaxID=63359 RepID=A0AAP0RMX0_LIQFO